MPTTKSNLSCVPKFSEFQQYSLFCIFGHSDVYIIFQLSQNLNIDYFNMYFDIQNVRRNSCG